MPYYQYLRDLPQSERRRTAAGLLRLKDALATHIPGRSLSENLLIATWNIREFDSKNYGERMQEAIYYIAEIIGHFDLVAVQEVNENLDGFYRLKKLLGHHWQSIYTDVTVGRRGNRERLAFLYDSRKLSFTSLAGEIVIPPHEERDESGSTIYQPAEQLARTPFIIGLRASWFSFTIATLHILYGSGRDDDPRRVKEIGMLSDFLAERTDDPNAQSPNLILLGDFNIFKPENDTYREITRNFYIPPEIQHLPSNVRQNKFYDQVAFRGNVPTDEIQGGVFNFYDYVYRPEDEEEYASYMPDTYHDKDDPEDRRRYYEVYWRTHQMSDHLPMWVELKIDFSRPYLSQFLED